MLDETYTLANGVQIPKVGLGTWFIDDGVVAGVVREAVAAGYRHVDTAQDYGNEAGVGEGVRTCGIPRDELFVTTKLSAAIKRYDDALAAIDRSLSTMDLEHLDLVIIHSPQPWTDFGGEDRHFEGNREAWRALEAAHSAGKVRAIGLSNFTAVDVDNVLGACTVAPVVNQVLAHVTNTPTELIDHCVANGMLVEAYSPIGHGQLLANPQLVRLAERYEVSVAQLAIRYTLQLGLLPLPKAANPVHLRSNAELDFEISSADMAEMEAMDEIEDYGEAGVFPVFARR
jgi:diketogulonate reductase-like aldo/keto reductase